MKTIAVVGATGAMGRSVVRALVDHPSQEFQVRALTRNPTGKRANELKGYSDKISTIQADTNDQKSLEAAFRGVHGVFCNTESNSVILYSSCIHKIRLMIPLWELITPFGLPVEPDV